MTQYIVSLTTIPSKFDSLYLTIDSLYQQTLRPHLIILNIPAKYDFRLNSAVIPEEAIQRFTEKYPDVIINRIDKDYGPGTKLLGIFHNNVLKDCDPANTFIVLVDDDLIYKPFMIDRFDETHNNKAVNVFTYCPMNIYGIDYSPYFAQGSDGLFIRLNILDRYTDYYKIIKGFDYVNYHDDFYLSYFFHITNQFIHYLILPDGEIVYDTHVNSRIDALSSLQGKYERSNLNAEIIKILKILNAGGAFDRIKN